MDKRSDGRAGLIALALLVAAMIGVWVHKQLSTDAPAPADTAVAVAPERE